MKQRGSRLSDSREIEDRHDVQVFGTTSFVAVTPVNFICFLT
jgi:hypothetical protein